MSTFSEFQKEMCIKIYSDSRSAASFTMMLFRSTINSTVLTFEVQWINRIYFLVESRNRLLVVFL